MMEKASLKHYNCTKPPNGHGGTGLFFKPVIQTKLYINEPGDQYEREAEAMADKVMRMTDAPASPPFFNPAGNAIQRKCQACEEEDKHVHRKENVAGEAIGSNELDSYVGSLKSSGQPMPDNSRHFFESRFGHDFSKVRLHTDSVAAKSAQSINALAYTSGNNIVFNSGQYSPESNSGKKLIAHELKHVVQQQNSKQGGTTINRQPVNTPYNKALVEQSKRRLKVLQPRLDYLKSRETQIEIDKVHAAADRKSLDENSSQIGWQATERQEEFNFSKMNKGAFDISVTGDAVVFNVRFQAYFLDPKNKKFGQLKKSLTDGIALVWNQTLSGSTFGGRKFSVVPDISLINSLSERKADHWLIEVRKGDQDPAIHQGCNFPAPVPGTPTAITDTLCDNGVMNLPPLHVGKPGIIGHELLHLFGLLDRYMILSQPSAKKGGKPKVDLSKTRETGGRKDPLGAEDGTVLSEDLNYILLKLGVFDQEKSQGLAELPIVQKEVWRLEKIVKLGYDPDSLIPVRKDFNDKMLKDAENVP